MRKEAKDKVETTAHEGNNKAKEPKEQTDGLTPDVIANASAKTSAKTACKEATRKVEEVKLAVMMAGEKPLKLYSNLLSDKA